MRAAYFRILITSVLLGPTCAVQAANWAFTPYVTLGEIYTDNVTLAPEGQEQEDFITLINPGFLLTREQGRVRANIAYQMQNLFYAKESDFNETHHQLDALGVAEIAPEHLYIDATTSISQQVIDPQQVAATENRSVTGNRTDVTTASISPYIRHDFGTSTQGLARYRYGIVDFDESEVGNQADDATLNGGLIALGSNPEGRRFGWLAAYNNEQVHYDNIDASDTFQKAGLRLDFGLTSKLGLVAIGGYEDNKFERSTTTFDPDSSFWSAGFTLDPTSHDRIQALYGERFFGNTYLFSWEHRARRFATQVNYSEDVRTVAQSLLGDTGQFLEYGILDSSGDVTGNTSANPINNTALDPQTGLPVGGLPDGSGVDPISGLPLGGLSLSTELFVAKRLDASILIETAKTNTQFTVFQEDREFNDSALSNDERVRSAQAVFSWRFASRTEALAGADFARFDFDDDDETADLIRFTVGLQHDIGTRTQARIQATRAQRESDDLNEYVENAVVATVTRSF